MIKENTLFILGAGASKPYGYPTGQELREYIISRFPIDYIDILKIYYTQSESSIDSAMKAVKDFVDVFDRSTEPIDKFLSMNPEKYPAIGKIAITVAILVFEYNSRFREKAQGGKDEDWYSLLFRTMTSTLSTPESLEGFPENKVAFITFNYDRSLEHFLFTALSNAFHDQEEKIWASSSKYLPFPIIHVYGQIDKPEWSGGLEYRSDIDYARIDSLKKNIRIIGERTKDESDKIEKLIDWAKRIYFLGFGYADENLDFLGRISDRILPISELHIFGTAPGKNDEEMSEIKWKFVKRSIELNYDTIDRIFQLRPAHCYSLLREFPLT